MWSIENEFIFSQIIVIVIYFKPKTRSKLDSKLVLFF
jgi:hypothetical protein